MCSLKFSFTYARFWLEKARYVPDQPSGRGTLVSRKPVEQETGVRSETGPVDT